MRSNTAFERPVGHRGPSWAASRAAMRLVCGRSTRSLAVMNRLLLALTLCLALSCAVAREHSPPEKLDEWMMYYYLDPRPDEVEAALKAITAQGYFENDDVQAPLSGFFAEVFRANPDKISAWVKPYVGVPKRHILYSALWMANSRESKDALEQLAKGAKDAEARSLRELASSTPPTVETMVLDSPAALDYMWGSFMASGSDKPVLRVIDQMKLVNRKGDIGAQLIGGAAEWSVSANTRQHERVQRVVRTRAESADSETKVLLKKIVAKLDAEKRGK